MGWWADAETTNVTNNFSSSDCSASSDVSSTTQQTTRVQMTMDCSFSFIGNTISSAIVKCPDGSDMTPSDSIRTTTQFHRDCEQIAVLDIKSEKETSSKFTAACMQDNKTITKQKAESVAGLSFPGSSASASNYTSSTSAQRAETLSAFYSMSSQETSVDMVLDAHTTIAQNKMDACAMRTLLGTLGDVHASQSLSIKASMDDRVSVDTKMKMEQFNSTTTDQTATAKVEMSMMWILLLLLIIFAVVMVGPILFRMVWSMLFAATKGVAGMAVRAAGATGSALASTASAASMMSMKGTRKTLGETDPRTATTGLDDGPVI
jgi:hypothetical protein